MPQPIDWKPIAKVKPEKLSSTRRSLHLALQAVANVGRAYAPSAPDHGQVSLRWLPKLNGMAGQPVASGAARLVAALCFDPLEWQLLDGKGAVVSQLPFAGKNLAQMESAIREVLKKNGLDETRYSIKPAFAVDPHPLLEGGLFSPEWDEDERRELAHYYAGVDQILRALAAEFQVAQGPRGWPHHFDYALLLTFNVEPGKARSVGLGMSPGDKHYDQPYFYSTPWPYPPVTNLPAIPKPASWHTQEWTGAVLLASDLPPVAGTALAAYWRASFALLRSILEKTPA